MPPHSLLLVDDHRIFVEGLRHILETQNDLLVVGETDRLESAIEQIQRLRPELVLLDLGLKDGNGLNALPQIRAKAPETRVIVLSGYGPEHVLPALRLGAHGFVSKDTASTSLLTAIRAVLRGEIWAPPQEAGQWLQELSRQDRSEGDALTPREQQVLQLIGEGKRNKEIARTLQISENTVKTHISSLVRKLGIDDRWQLIVYAARTGYSRSVREDEALADP